MTLGTGDAMEPEPRLLGDALEGRVLALWGGVLGVDAAALDRDGLVVVAGGRNRLCNTAQAHHS